MILIADLESNGLLPDVTKIWHLSVKALGSTHIEHYTDSHPERPSIQEGLARLLEADTTVWHNGLQYDLPAIAKVYGVELDWRKVVDTMVLSRLGKPEKPSHALATYGERFGVPKPVHEDWTQWSLAMEHRCGVDVEITERVYELLKPMLKLQPKAVEIEHACHWQTGKMMQRGFPLDEEYVYEQVNRLLSEQEEILEELHATFTPILVSPEAALDKKARTLKTVNRNHPLYGQLDAGNPYCPVVVQEFNPGSNHQVASRLKAKYGWKPASFTPTGQPEVSEETLRGLPYPEARVFVKFLRNQKNLGFMHGEPKRDGSGGGWLHHTRGGRVYAYINACKAVTGRPSCSSPNLQQVPKVGWLRRAFLPGDGRSLVGVDASGIELRVLGHYLASLDGGAYAREVVDGDIHTKVMNAIGFDHGARDHNGKPIGRDHTKRIEYGQIYGAGNLKLGLIAMENAAIQADVLGCDRRELLKGDLAKIGSKIRRQINAAIPGYKELDKQVKDKARMVGKLKGLDGRTLWVRYVHASLNLLIQSGAIIIIKEAMRLAPAHLETQGLREGIEYDPLIWVHDEWQVASLPECADLVGKMLAETFSLAGQSLGVRCKLGGEYAVGSNWSETH